MVLYLHRVFMPQWLKDFLRSCRLTTQKALTAKNIGGYDALTVINLVINGAWDGHVCFPQNGKLRATADCACFAIWRRHRRGHALYRWSCLAERRSRTQVFRNFCRRSGADPV